MTYADYPDAAKSNARRALKHKRENGSDCGTRVGWFRAEQISSGEGLTEDEGVYLYNITAVLTLR